METISTNQRNPNMPAGLTTAAAIQRANDRVTRIERMREERQRHAQQSLLGELLAAIVKNHGFMTMEQVDRLKSLDRLRLVLVRCGNGRLMCPAQDARHWIEVITNDKTDYVRDISLPAGDMAFSIYG